MAKVSTGTADRRLRSLLGVSASAGGGGGGPGPGGGPLALTASKAQDNTSGFGNDFNVPLAAGADGDLILIVLCYRNTATFTTTGTPTGWDLVIDHGVDSDRHRIAIYSRIKQSGDPTSVSFTCSSPSGQLGASSSFAFSGTTGIEVADADMVNALTVTPPSVSSALGGHAVTVFANDNSFGAWSSATSGWSEAVDFTCNPSVLAQHALYIADAPTAAGTVSGPTGTLTGNTWAAAVLLVATLTP